MPGPTTAKSEKAREQNVEVVAETTDPLAEPIGHLVLKPAVTKGVVGSNNPTRSINGILNVNKARVFLIQHIRARFEHDVSLMNAHFPLSGIAETLITQLCKESISYSKTDDKNNDMYNMSVENLRRGVRESKELSSNLIQFSEDFDKNQLNYVQTFFDDEAALRKLISTKVFDGAKNVGILYDAINYICFIVSSALCILIKTVYHISLDTRRSITPTTFRTAVRIHFRGGLLQHLELRLGDIAARLNIRKNEKKKQPTKKSASKSDETEGAEEIGKTEETGEHESAETAEAETEVSKIENDEEAEETETGESKEEESDRDDEDETKDNSKYDAETESESEGEPEAEAEVEAETKPKIGRPKSSEETKSSRRATKQKAIKF